MQRARNSLGSLGIFQVRFVLTFCSVKVAQEEKHGQKNKHCYSLPLPICTSGDFSAFLYFTFPFLVCFKRNRRPKNKQTNYEYTLYFVVLCRILVRFANESLQITKTFSLNSAFLNCFLISFYDIKKAISQPTSIYGNTEKVTKTSLILNPVY